MTADVGIAEAASVTPAEAFASLGNQTRMEILQALAEADEPLSYSALRKRVGMRDSGQFTYHLKKLEGPFVRHAEDGYVLEHAGRRVIEAIYSGVLTDVPSVDRIEVDHPCSRCGAPIEVRVKPGQVEMYCTSCAGVYGQASADGSLTMTDAHRGYLGKIALPPAGFQNRTPAEAYRAAQVWGHLEVLSIANGVCPRCSARLEHAPIVCADHDASDGLCSACGNRYAAMMEVTCTNCIFRGKGGFGILLFAHPAVQAFKVTHGQNLVAPTPGPNPLSNLSEEILSVDPFAARFTYEYEGDTLTMAVDEDLQITDVETDNSPA